MLCQDCNQRSATVHLTKIINGQKTEIYLCEECAWEKKEMGLSGEPFSFHNLLAGILNPSPEKEVMSHSYEEASLCPGCGLDFREFSREGLFGCGDCYGTFQERLDGLLRRIHGSSKHTGKIPLRCGGVIRKRQEIEELRQRLQKAVEREAFEEAAVLRDSIKDREKELD